MSATCTSHPHDRSYVGVIGPTGTRLLAVNGSPDNIGRKISLGSGAQALIKEDGTWIYEPHASMTNQADGTLVFDSVQYEICFDDNRQVGHLNISAPGLKRCRLLRNEASAENRRTHDEPHVLLIEMHTFSKIGFYPTQILNESSVAAAAVHSDVVVILEESSHGDTEVHDDGLVTFHPVPDFCGETTVRCLVQGQGGEAQFLDLLIRVVPAVIVESTFVEATEPTLDDAEFDTNQLIKSAQLVGVAPRVPAPQLSGYYHADSVLLAYVFGAGGEFRGRSQARTDMTGFWTMALQDLNRRDNYQIVLTDRTGNVPAYGELRLSALSNDWE